MPTTVTARARETLLAQAGAISLSQALACGMSRHAVRRAESDGHWQRTARGVYLAEQEPRWLGRVWAGVLAAGAGAVVGRSAAAHLWGLTEVPAWPVTIFCLVPPRAEPQPWWEFRRATRHGRGAPPRTSIEETLLDDWSLIPDEEFLARLGSAVARRKTTLRRVRDELDQRQRCPRRGDLRALVGDVAEGVRSPLERLYLTNVERSHGLPRGTRQCSLSRGTESDVVYDDWRLVVELDGRRGHGGTGAFRDMARDNLHLQKGFVTLRYGYVDIRHRPCEVAAQVAEVLASRGWSGTPTTCSRCRRAA